MRQQCFSKVKLVLGLSIIGVTVLHGRVVGGIATLLHTLGLVAASLAPWVHIVHHQHH